MNVMPGVFRPGPIQNRGPLAPNIQPHVPIYNMIQPPMPTPMMAPEAPQMPRQVRMNQVLDQLRQSMLEARLAQLQKARERM